jgi:hypothetical protein
MATKAPKLDPLDALMQDPLKVMALMIWVNRHRNPDMFFQINEADLEAFDACMKYQKLKPGVLIKRPPEIPGQAAIPATGNRRAIPARAAIPARPYVMVSLVEIDKAGKLTENAIRPVENNEDDYDTQQQVAAVRRAKDRAPDLANQILKGAANGETSLSDIQDAADALLTLSRAA